MGVEMLVRCEGSAGRSDGDFPVAFGLTPLMGHACGDGQAARGSVGPGSVPRCGFGLCTGPGADYRSVARGLAEVTGAPGGRWCARLDRMYGLDGPRLWDGAAAQGSDLAWGHTSTC